MSQKEGQALDGMVSGNHNDKAPTDDPSKLAEQKEIEESVEEEAEQ